MMRSLRCLHPSVLRQIELRLERSLRDLPSPGLNAAILIDDGIVWTYAAGLAQYDPDHALTCEHLHRVGSITKLFTAHAVMMLRERGLLELDRPVRDFIPEFNLPAAQGVTIRHILCHGSGITSEGGNFHDVAQFPDRTQFKQLIREFKPLIPPMTYLKYSNAAYSMLGIVIESASGTPYDLFVADNILQPLGLNDTSFQVLGDRHQRLVKGYVLPPFERRFVAAPQPDMKAYSPCGMLATTTTDLLKFAAAQWANTAIVSSTTLDEMRRLHLPNHHPSDSEVGYGLGWQIWGQGSRLLWGHSGGYIGHRCALLLSLEQRVAVAIFANCGHASKTMHLAGTILADVIDALDNSRPQPNHAVTLADDRAHGLLGNFGTTYWFQIKIELDGDGLFMTMSSDPRNRIGLTPLKAGVFGIDGGRYIGEELVIEQRDDKGGVQRIGMAGFTMTRI